MSRLKTITFLLLIVPALTGWAQLRNNFIPADSAQIPHSKYFPTLKKGLDFHMEVGTSFGTNFNGGSLFTTYIAPQFSYQVSERFHLNGGISLAHNTSNNFMLPAYHDLYGIGYTPVSGNFLNASLFIQGEYQVNERLLINGTAYKQTELLKTPKVNPQAFNFEGEGIAVGFEYKIGENSSIGAQFGVSRQSSPYHPINQAFPLSNPGF